MSYLSASISSSRRIASQKRCVCEGRRAPCRKRNRDRSARKRECGHRGAHQLNVERWTLNVGRFRLPSNSIVTAEYPALPIFRAPFLCRRSRLRLAQTPPLLRRRQSPKSVVYSIHENAAIKEYRTNPAVVREMVDRLVIAVTAQTDVAKAWGSLVSPNEKVGIKISAAGGELFTTHRDVVNAIVDGLVAGGHSRKDIIVWDRNIDGIKEAGYQPGGKVINCSPFRRAMATMPKAIFSAPAMGKLIWGDLDYIPQRGENPMRSETANTSDVSHFAKIVTGQVTKIINVPVMSDSYATGLAGCLNNVTLPNIDNWRRFAQYGRFGVGRSGGGLRRSAHRSQSCPEHHGRTAGGLRGRSERRSKFRGAQRHASTRAKIRWRSTRSPCGVSNNCAPT